MHPTASAGNANVRQARLLAGKPREVTLDRCTQCGVGPSRQREQGWTHLICRFARCRRSFDHDESVRATKAERIDRGKSRIACGPLAALRIDEKRTRGKVDLRVGVAE